MNKILILDHSHQFGYISKLAEAFLKSCQETGGEATLHNTNHVQAVA